MVQFSRPYWSWEQNPRILSSGPISFLSLYPALGRKKEKNTNEYGLRNGDLLRNSLEVHYERHKVPWPW